MILHTLISLHASTCDRTCRANDTVQQLLRPLLNYHPAPRLPHWVMLAAVPLSGVQSAGPAVPGSGASPDDSL